MKKAIALILVLMTALLAVPALAVTGQNFEENSTVFPGVTMKHITTPSGSKYGLQDMRIVTFDPKQEGLSVNVATGYSALNKLSTVSNTVSRWNAANPDKVPLVGINGDWFTVSYDDYSSGMAKQQLYIPLGFNMHGGEIVTTQQTAVETANSGYAPSFGVAADGTPLIGCIDTAIVLQTGGSMINLDGINRLPANNAIIMYTDRGPSSNYCLDDAYEIYIDYDHDIAVKDGFLEASTVAAISRPGEARQAMKANRIILTARGTRIPEIENLAVGSRVRIKVTISDRYGNTEKWKTVTDCVGGHHEFARNGEYFAIGDSTHYPANIIGITADNKVIFLCNDGRQSDYSVGVSINKMPELSRELGIVSGIYMDGGGSTTMVCRESGSYKLVNRPCNNGHAERTVTNAVILACDKVTTDDFTFDTPSYALNFGAENNARMLLTDGGLNVITITAYDPFVNLVDIGLSADEYKYIAFDIKTNYAGGGSHKVGLYLSAGATTYATESCKASFSVPETGRSERVFVDLTSLSLWNGDAHTVRIDIFDDASGIAVGRGVVIREMKFCKTKDEAENFCRTITAGDVNGDGMLTIRDLSAIKSFIAGLSGDYLEAAADVNGDGLLTISDISALKLLLA